MMNTTEELDEKMKLIGAENEDTLENRIVAKIKLLLDPIK